MTSTLTHQNRVRWEPRDGEEKNLELAGAN